MSRWLSTAALLAALVLLAVSGCGPSAATGSSKGGAPTNASGSNTGKAADSGKDTAKGAAHHDPG